MNRKLWIPIAALLAALTPAIIYAVSETVTRDTTQVPCPAIDSASSECRNLRLNNTTKGLLVSIAGTETGAGGQTMTQGTAAAAGSGWPVYLQPPIAVGTGPFLRAGTGVNAAVTTTVAAVASQRVFVSGVCAGYAGTPTTVPVLSLADGTTTVQKSITSASTIPGQYCLNLGTGPLTFASGAALTVTLPAAGTGVTGELVVWGYQQ